MIRGQEQVGFGIKCFGEERSSPFFVLKKVVELARSLKLEIRMQIVREYLIDEVARAQTTNGEYRVVLRKNPGGHKKSTIQFGEADLERLGLDFDKLRPWGILVCTFVSRERTLKMGKLIHPKAKFRIGDEVCPMSQDEMLIEKITKTETSQNFSSVAEKMRVDTSYRLRLVTPRSGGMISIWSYPSYKFNVELSPEEYEECKAFSGRVVFGVRFEYRAEEPPRPMTRSEMAKMSAETATD